MKNPTLKHNLLVSLIIINIGLILSVALIENEIIHSNHSSINQSIGYELITGIIGAILITGIIFFIYSLNRIFIANKG